jgi:hypothetical protein
VTTDTAFDDLASQIETDASLAGLPIAIRSGAANGFGVQNMTTLDVSTQGSDASVRLWDEGQGDFWIEVGGARAAWWRQGRKEAMLAEVVIALVEGRFSVDNGRITVFPRGRTSLALRERL